MRSYCYDSSALRYFSACCSGLPNYGHQLSVVYTHWTKQMNMVDHILTCANRYWWARYEEHSFQDGQGHAGSSEELRLKKLEPEPAQQERSFIGTSFVHNRAFLRVDENIWFKSLRCSWLKQMVQYTMLHTCGPSPISFLSCMLQLPMVIARLHACSLMLVQRLISWMMQATPLSTWLLSLTR